jgi:hypothetical protein
VQLINHESMGMLWAMLGKVWVIRWQVRVVMRQNAFILRRPDAQDGDQTKGTDPSQQQGSNRQSRASADPPCEWIGHQPTGMA